MSTNGRPRVFAAGELEEILARFGVVVSQHHELETVEPGEWQPGGFSDDDVLRILFDEFERGDEYRQLYQGELEYDDESAGDWRLIKALAWVCGPDADQVERLARDSQRVRAKWDTRRHGKSFLRWQVDKAITEHTRNNSFYDSRGANATPWFVVGPQDEDEEEAEEEQAAPPPPAPTAVTPVAEPEPEGLAPIPDYPTHVLPEPMRELVNAGVQRGLEAALVGGPALAAAAVAVGNQAELQAMLGWTERAILWVPGVAPPGIGKSPGQQLAFGPLRAWNEDLLVQYANDLEMWHALPLKTRPASPPKDPSILSDDITLEALARIMDGNGALGADLDELSGFLTGLGQYKQSGASDRSRLLRLWTGNPWRYTRVGSGGRAINVVNILIPLPTLVICGNLPTEQHVLLGDDRDGLRPRWLPHLAGAREREPPDLSDVDVKAWADVLSDILSFRETKRVWRLSDAAKITFQKARKRWKQLERGDENASTSAALAKADVHSLRVVLVFAEVSAPGQGGDIAEETMAAAITVVDYTLDCWRALGSGEHLSLSFRDEALNKAIPRLVAWLERRGGVTSDVIRQNRVGGVHTAVELKALLARYEAIYPGSIKQVSTAGRPAIVVSPPARRKRPI